MAIAIKKAESEMASRREAMENRSQSIKDYILRCMRNSGINKIECPYFKISIRTNPQKVIIDDESKIPLSYMRQPDIPPPIPDKKAILNDIKVGVIVDGCHSEQGNSLVIK
jgi:hypothetical protein